MSFKRWIGTVLALGLAAVAIALAVGGSSPADDGAAGARSVTTSEDPAPRRVVVARVEAADGRRAVRLSGIVEARDRARLALEVGGRLVERRVDLGERFAAGAVLARLDRAPFDHEVAATLAGLGEIEARLAQAEREHRRTEDLAERGAATAEEREQTGTAVDGLQAARRSAWARLEEARRRAGETVLVAPFAGRVTRVHREPGEQVAAGATILEVAGDSGLEVEVEAPESVLPHLRTTGAGNGAGSTVPVHLPFLDATVPGRIESVAEAATPGRLFPVVVVLDAEAARAAGAGPGVTAEVELSAGAGDALAVPLGAVIDPGGGRPSLYRVVVGPGGVERAQRLRLEVGRLVPGADPAAAARVVVRVTTAGVEPLAAGDRVVVGGFGSLQDGDPVEVSP